MCSENFPGGLIFSRGGPKLILNQVPDLWVSYFHRNECLQNPRIGLESTTRPLFPVVKNISAENEENNWSHHQQSKQTNSVLYRCFKMNK